MSLVISLRSEILKTKRTAALYFTLIGAAVIPLMFLFAIISHGLPEEERTAKDPINALFNISSEMTGICFFPLFVVLICTLLPQIEFRNTAWKQVLTSPQTKANVFLAKFLNIHFMLLVFLVASHLYMWVVIIVAHLMLPELDILQHPFHVTRILTDNANTYIAGLAIGTIQFWIGLRTKNFIVPIAIGVACWLVGTIMVFEYQSAASVYFPYSFHGIRFSKFRAQTELAQWLSSGYAVLFLILGFWDFKRRKMAR